MIRVIVSARFRHVDDSVDLEIPAEMPAAQLATNLAAALSSASSDAKQKDPPSGSGAYQIYVESLNRVLAPTETLADANLWDGSSLVLDSFTSAKLIYTDTNNTKISFPIEKHSVLLGRIEENTSEPSSIVDLGGLDGYEYISLSHAKMCFENNQWQLEHLSSTNKTYHNDIELTEKDPVILTDGDTIRLAAIELEFRLA